MKVTWGLNSATHIPRTITTLGSYDGVHLGHQKILQRLIDRKAEFGCERSLVLTFHPHPQQVLRRNNTSVELLTTIEERLELLEALGIDETVVIEFTREFAQTSYIDFFQRTIVEQLGTTRMVVGYNHAFGKNREGDAESLKVLAPELGVAIEEIGPFILDGTAISSTAIRNALKERELDRANSYLGRNYGFSGKVVHGDALGRELGFPTANLSIDPVKVIPADGVYAAMTSISSAQYLTALSIGTRPTLGEDKDRTIEALLLDFEGDLYDAEIRMKCLRYLREQQRFDSLDELKAWIAKDVEQIRSLKLIPHV